MCEISANNVHQIVEQIAEGVAAQYFLEAGCLNDEVAKIKLAFARPEMDEPIFTKAQVQSLIQSVTSRLANVLPSDAASRVAMLVRIQKGSVKKIDILAETGLAVTDDGLEATWSKAQRMPLLEACRSHGVKLASHFSLRSFNSRL